MNHNFMAMLAVAFAASVAVVCAYRAPTTLGYAWLGYPFWRFAVGTAGFIVGMYVMSLLSLIFERTRPAFSAARTTFFALTGAVVGFFLNFTILPFAAQAFRNPAGAESGINLTAWEFYLILPLVAAYLASRAGFTVHGRMSKATRWGFLACFIVVIGSGFWFFGGAKA